MKYRNTILTFTAAVLSFTTGWAAAPTLTAEDFDIDNIVFIEEDQNLELGFDTSKYLPENFDPFSTVVPVGSVNYVDICDEIELGFETDGYLPEDFDPYIQ